MYIKQPFRSKIYMENTQILGTVQWTVSQSTFYILMSKELILLLYVHDLMFNAWVVPQLILKILRT